MMYKIFVYLIIVCTWLACSSKGSVNHLLPGIAEVDVNRIELKYGETADVLIRELDGEWYYAGMDQVSGEHVELFIGLLEGLTCPERISAR